mmetsp:Transcript_91084/g.254498  ORF Transcript_91084/g.254498 Transcript_91084/m.254498 type:complete len:260 (+) Transcript_91084:209-988(+)
MPVTMSSMPSFAIFPCESRCAFARAGISSFVSYGAKEHKLLMSAQPAIATSRFLEAWRSMPRMSNFKSDIASKTFSAVCGEPATAAATSPVQAATALASSNLNIKAFTACFKPPMRTNPCCNCSAVGSERGGRCAVKHSVMVAVSRRHASREKPPSRPRLLTHFRSSAKPPSTPSDRRRAKSNRASSTSCACSGSTSARCSSPTAPSHPRGSANCSGSGSCEYTCIPPAPGSHGLMPGLGGDEAASTGDQGAGGAHVST